MEYSKLATYTYPCCVSVSGITHSCYEEWLCREGVGFLNWLDTFKFLLALAVFLQSYQPSYFNWSAARLCTSTQCILTVKCNHHRCSCKQDGTRKIHLSTNQILSFPEQQISENQRQKPFVGLTHNPFPKNSGCPWGVEITQINTSA